MPVDRLRLLAVIALQAAILAAIPSRQVKARASGVDVTLETAPVDPLDPLSGYHVTLRYRAQPTEGLYFRTREMGYRPEDEHLWTQSEAIQARHWFPCYDAPNDKTTWEFLVTVDSNMKVLSNGHLVSVTPATGGSQKTWHWLQDKPASTYLYSVVAGPFGNV